MKSILLVKKFLGLVEMTSVLVNASFSLPEWQAVKMISLHPVKSTINKHYQPTEDQPHHSDKSATSPLNWGNERVF